MKAVKNIVVLAGGLSHERDVSLSSGTKITRALIEQGYNAVLVDLFFGLDDISELDAVFSSGVSGAGFSVSTSVPDLERIKAERREGCGGVGKNVIELCRAADIVFMALHGDDGENGRIQAMLDVYGIRYTGSGYLGSALAMNKPIAKELMKKHGIPTPAGRVYKKKDAERIAKDFSLPCVIKPADGGSSIGVSIPKTAEELCAAIEQVFRYGDEALVEEFIAGREIQAGVLGGTALPLIEIIPEKGAFYDYANKYQAGVARELCPAPIPDGAAQKIQRLAQKTMKALFLSVYSRIDFILTEEGEAYCLEANTLPGMTPTSLLPQEAAAAGIDYGTLCRRIIELSMEKYA